MMKRLAFLFLVVILAAQSVRTRDVAAVELPAGSVAAAQTLPSAGNRRLLQDTVVRDYTAWCTPTRNSRLDQDSLDTAQAAYVPLQPFDEGLIGPGVDLCNSGVYNVSGQAVKLPATITGSVTETALPDGRRVTLALQVSGVEGVVTVVSNEVLTDPNIFGYGILGIYYLSSSNPPDTSGLSKEEFFKTLALVQSLTYTLIFELHDNSKPGAPLTVKYFDIFDPSIPTITLISEDFANLVIKGPLRPSPLFPNLPRGNPAEFTFNSLTLGNGTIVDDVNLNILPPDDGSVLETLNKEFPKNATETPSPTASTGTNSSTAPVPTGTSASVELAPVRGVCDPYGAAPNQCFSASGGASICCSGQCPTPGPDPSCTAAGTAAPTTGTPAATASPGPTPTATASATSAPSTKCDANSARPNQCFNANGSAFICCAGGCGPSGAEPLCAT